MSYRVFYIAALLLFLFVISSCNKQKKVCAINIIKEGIYEIQIPGAIPFLVATKGGKRLSVLSDIEIDSQKFLQELTIDSTGLLLSKIIFNYEGQLDGQQYYFFENSVNLQVIETYKKNRKNGVGLKFHEGGLPGRIEVVSNYSEEGYLFSRKFYDTSGNSIKIEDTDTGFGSDVAIIKKDSSGHIKQFDKEQ